MNLMKKSNKLFITKYFHFKKNRKYLIDLDVNNKYSLDMIETSIFAIVLDDSFAYNNTQVNPNN